MKVFLAVTVAMWMACGCAWMPERDNAVDPASRFFTAPPQSNRPPEIDSLRMIFDCQHNFAVGEGGGDLSSFDLVCGVSDPDRNVFYDSVYSFMRSPSLDSIPLGYLAFDPARSEFFIQRNQNDFPGHSFRDLLLNTLWVTAHDDSGAVATQHIAFRTPPDNWPNPVFPSPNPPQDTVRSYHPKLSWELWQPGTTNHTFTVTVYDKYSLVAWDTSGLPASDTTVVVSDSLLDSFTYELTYSWRLTVVNEIGDRLMSLPAYFVVWPTSRVLAANEGIPLNGVRKQHD